MTLAPRRISRPCFINILFASSAICLSIIARKSSSASSKTTSDPRRPQTEPSSRPITPAPIIPKRFGTESISSAPVESKIKSLSTSATGISMGLDPAAKITLFAVTSVSAPFSSVIVTLRLE